MTLRILAPVSEEAAALSALILPLVVSAPVQVTLFRVGDGGVLGHAERVFRMRGLDARPQQGEGDPAREISLLAKAGRFDLIAMITHGRRGLGRALLGSVADSVLRSVSVPLLLARPGTPAGPWRLVVAALDGSPRAERVLPMAGRLAKVAGTPLHLIRVHGPGEAREAREYLDRACAGLGRRGVVALPVLRRGLSASGIVRYARDIQAGVLCLGTHGRTGLRRLLLGSVAEEVVRRSPCPVLVVKP